MYEDVEVNVCVDVNVDVDVYVDVDVNIDVCLGACWVALRLPQCI